MFDLIIIGGGPAGCGAAVYAARKQIKTLLITPAFGGQSDVSAEIFNWIGTPSISGADLAKSLEKHVRDYEGEFLTIEARGEIAQSLTRKEDGTGFALTTSGGTAFEATTILITSGSSRRKLTIPGADTYENRGVVYCASCDGPLFAGKNVAVIGGGNAGFETAAQLLAYCPSDTLMQKSDSFKADEITVQSVLKHPNMHALLSTEPTEVIGGEIFVESLKYKNTVTDEEGELPVEGIFVEIGQIPNTNYVGDIADKTSFGNIVTDPRTQETSCVGIWAAGDVTDGLYHQNNIAVGDAVKAIEDIYMFLARSK